MPPKKTARKKVSRSPKNRRRTAGKKTIECPVVGIGGSAGGFEAAMVLLQHLPADNGMTFVIVQHLDPHHVSKLASLLGKVTAMRVFEITKSIRPKPNTVYVQPPNKCVVIKDGELTLIQRSQRLNVGIDQFFESLAESCGGRAIGVLLSGTGSDGTAGLRAIKAAGGLTFAQDEETAKFPEMPRSAIRTGSVDAVRSPREIARELRHIAQHPYLRRPMNKTEAEEAIKSEYEKADDLSRIFLSLRKQMGVDFASYKMGTLTRRIERRMALHKMKKLGEYALFLRDNTREIEALFDDLLINVTRFFRDPPLFKALRKNLLHALVKNKTQHGDLRIWVPGCATGEEVYSLAICILETLGTHASEMRIQIFGTDLSEVMIDHARAGIYPKAIEKDVSSSRLRLFFTKRDGAYQIDRRVRDICTFARQNVVTDPPFSRLDLISCRNVLIYLSPELHKRCIPQFHLALNPGGYLILGSAESVGTFDELFRLIDKKNKIYAKKMVPTPRPTGLPADFGTRFWASGMRFPNVGAAASSAELLQAADRIMLGTYAPAAVVIDHEMHVQQYRGQTEPYLAHPPGPASLNILQMVRASLVADLRNAIRRSIKTSKPARKERCVIKHNGKAREVNIQVVPFKIPDSDRAWLLIIFDETTMGTRPGKALGLLGKSAAQREIIELRRELATSKESLQAIIEEQEATNEELKSANEEIESSNEELQSTNEELETAKEELQSTNEELLTLNEELTNRNLEMQDVNSDLNNLLASVQLPIVMVDNDLLVRRVTPAARNAFSILQSDVGRPISDFRPNINIPDLEELLRDVIESLAVRQRRVADKQGRQYSLRARPYRTSDNKIDGAVITLVDFEAKE
ncbi:MAG TPA: chemotaxis protein CheB [Candidatus Udaeobacter sp.]|jgi:two-component system CheB/CheR fusion protein|nr:chemotaxis protein CheB [Candidatus Udaeobacter sp.]